MILLIPKINSISIDCPDVINLAIGLNMDKTNPAFMNALQVDCCLYNVDAVTNFVKCTASASNPRVININWDALGLNGTINGTALTASMNSTLTWLSLKTNEISGTIPNPLPPKLTFLRLFANQLQGNIPNPLPSNLGRLYLHSNKLIGDIPNLPKSLVELMLGVRGSAGNNNLNGKIELRTPTRLSLFNIYITDLIIYDTSKLTTALCDISNTPLLGNPILANLTRCTKTGLYILPTSTGMIAFQSLSSTKISFEPLIFLGNTPLSSDTGSQSSEEMPLPTYIITTMFPKNSDLFNLDTSDEITVEVFIIYCLIGGFIILVMLVVLGSLIFKHPVVHSKFSRRYSSETLETVNSRRKKSLAEK